MATVLAGVAQLQSDVIREAIDARGYWVSSPLLDAATCAEIAQLYDTDAVPFRSTIDMARYGFGNGEYKYFAHPLPDIVTTLRSAGFEYNCLPQDLYGEIHSPLQAIVLLDRPNIDFEGGELLLVEQRPRRSERSIHGPSPKRFYRPRCLSKNLTVTS